MPCLLFNARSLANKLPDFHLLLASSTFSLIIVTESWLSDVVSDAMIVEIAITLCTEMIERTQRVEVYA